MYGKQDLTIADLSNGIDVQSMEAYLELLSQKIRVELPNFIDEALLPVFDAINVGWQGAARDQFNHGIKKKVETAKWVANNDFIDIQQKFTDVARDFVVHDQNMLGQYGFDYEMRGGNNL